MTKPSENRVEKGFGTGGRSSLGSHRVRSKMKIHGISAWSLLPHLSPSLLPHSHGSFILMTSYTQSQPQHCHSTPIDASSPSVPAGNHSSLCFPILKPWVMTDIGRSSSQLSHKSRCPECAINLCFEIRYLPLVHSSMTKAGLPRCRWEAWKP